MAPADIVLRFDGGEKRPPHAGIQLYRDNIKKSDQSAIMQIEKYSLSFKKLAVDQKSVAAAMGYDDDSVNPQVEEEINEILSTSDNVSGIEGGYALFDSIGFEKKDFQVKIEGQSFNIHPILFQQIKNAECIAVFLCTIGHEIPNRSAQFMKEGNLLKGYICDIVGSLAVEAAMELIQEQLKIKMLHSGLKITNRYSPGYCGWDISEQRNLFALLPDKFCGVELTNTCLMVPVKSVSGIIGIGTNMKSNPYACGLCDLENCLYKKQTIGGNG